MDINLSAVEAAPQPAASVVVLRDDCGALEVLMLKRHGLSSSFAGAYVFPGGKIDASDAALIPHLDQAPAVLHAALREPSSTEVFSAQCYVAAVRECFEESGILFVKGLDAEAMDSAEAAPANRGNFAAFLSQGSLQLDTQSLVPWSRWITPRTPTVSNRRFDTRFFVSAAPTRQTARHDNHETTESLWLRPQDALWRYWQGDIFLAPPQILSLAHLARHSSVSSVLAQALSRGPSLVEPEPFDDESGARVLCYPGDARHSVGKRALPGPTRLTHRNGRFEPGGGFAGFFESTDFDEESRACIP